MYAQYVPFPLVLSEATEMVVNHPGPLRSPRIFMDHIRVYIGYVRDQAEGRRRWEVSADAGGDVRYGLSLVSRPSFLHPTVF